MGLLQLLKSLFGKSYLNKIMGTRTNVAKPIRMDSNSPFRKYSDEAFEEQKNIDLIEEKINEYGPYALSNKNPQELANFEANAQRLLQVKMKQGGVTENMIRTVEAAKKPKPQADIIDIATKQKVDDTGIMKLKTDLGIPEDVPSDSTLGELLLETRRLEKQLNIDMRNVMKKEALKKTKGDDFIDMTKASAKPISLEREGQVRTASREFLRRELDLGKIKLKPEETKSILQPSGGGTDPIDILRTYYGEDVLEALDDLAPKFMQTEKYSDYLKIIDKNLDESFFIPRKDPSIKQSYTDDEMRDIVNKEEDDLANKLKNLPDDIDPDKLANGGRPGFKFGTGLKLINLFGKQKTNAAKEIKRSIDNIFPTGDAKYDADVVVDEIMEYLNIDRDAVDGYDIIDLYDKAYNALTKQRFDAKKLMESVNQKGKGAVTTADNIPQPTKTLKSIEDTGSIDISKDEIAEEFANFMKRNDPEGYKKLEGMTDKINLKNVKPSYADKDKRIIPEGTTEEDIDLAILKGNFLRKYEGKIDSQLSKAIENDTNAQRVKEVIAEVEQAVIMEQKGMGAEEIINSLLDAANRKKNADGGLNYLMGL